MGSLHAARLATLSGVEFVGCYDLLQERAREISAKYSCRAFASVDELRGIADAVLIAVPTQAHLECALPLLREGVAVLLEKPISADVESAERIVETAVNNKAVLQIGHSERFNSVYRAARGTIKEPRFIETHRLAPFKGRGHDVAVVLDLMIHDIDLLLDLTSSQPSSIEAAGVGVITDSFDIVNARLTFPSGCIANVTSSRISVKQMRKLRVFQKSGYISMDLAKSELEVYRLVDKSSPQAEAAGPFSKFELPDGRVIIRENVEVEPMDALQSELESFIEAVEGKHPPLVSGEAGFQALKVAMQIEQLCLQYQKNL